MSSRSTAGGIFGRGVLLAALGIVIWLLWSARKAKGGYSDAGTATVTVDAAGGVVVGDVEADSAAPGP